MSTIAAAPGRVPAVSFTTAWWAVVRATLGTLILTVILAIPVLAIGQYAGLPVGHAGTAAPFAWPFVPDLLWFRLLDLLVGVGVSLWAACRLRNDLAHDNVTIGLVEALASAGVVMGLFWVSWPASLAATVPVAVLLRWAARPGCPEPLGVRRHARWIILAVLALCAGSVIAVNAIPVAAQANADCGSMGGTGIESPAGGGGSGGGPPQRFGYSPGRVGLPAVCVENRAWFARATVLGLDTAALPAERPWSLSLVRGVSYSAGPGVGFDPVGRFVLGARSHRAVFLLLHFNRCRPGMAGRTYTLASLPLRVRVYGRVETYRVRFNESVQTTCPGVG